MSDPMQGTRSLDSIKPEVAKTCAIFFLFYNSGGRKDLILFIISSGHYMDCLDGHLCALDLTAVRGPTIEQSPIH